MKLPKIFLVTILLCFFIGVESYGTSNQDFSSMKLDDILYSGTSSALLGDTIKLGPVSDENEEVEYDLVILDPGFDSWFLRNKKSSGFHELTYLQSWNKSLVSQWNSLVGTRLPNNCAPTMYIDYRHDIDYGLELNYKLFYYFWYVHEQCKLFHSRPGMWF